MKHTDTIDADQLLPTALLVAQLKHDDYVRRNQASFLECPPDDYGVYVYTYYDGTNYPIYHGYTTDAPQRARAHLDKAPWASWVQDVRYRKCNNAQQARRLESRLHKKVKALCAAGTSRQFAFHGQDWSELDRKYKCNHVTGDCRLPGGVCDREHIAQLIADAQARR